MDDLILDLERRAGHRQVALRRQWNRTISAGGKKKKGAKKKKKRRDRVRHEGAAAASAPPAASAAAAPSASPLEEQEYDRTKATLVMNVRRQKGAAAAELVEYRVVDAHRLGEVKAASLSGSAAIGSCEHDTVSRIASAHAQNPMPSVALYVIGVSWNGGRSHHVMPAFVPVQGVPYEPGQVLSEEWSDENFDVDNLWIDDLSNGKHKRIPMAAWIPSNRGRTFYVAKLIPEGDALFGSRVFGAEPPIVEFPNDREGVHRYQIPMFEERRDRSGQLRFLRMQNEIANHPIQ